MPVLDDLRKSRFFGNLSGEDLERLAGIALRKKFRKGEIIFNEGEEAPGFYMLEKGTIKIYKLSDSGKEQILRIVKSGEIFGEAPVFSSNVYPAYSRALEASSTIYFPADRFRGEIRSNPDLAMRMLASMAALLRHFALLVEQLSLRDVRSRLSEYLLGAPADKSGAVRLDISKRELAAHLGTKPETLSRAFGVLQGMGLIRVSGSLIEILDPDGIEEAAMGQSNIE